VLPRALPWQPVLEDSQRIDDALARTPIKRIRREKEFAIPAKAEETLLKFDAPRAEVDVCTSREMLHDLFNKYVYVISNSQRDFLIDTGFDSEEFKERDVAYALTVAGPT
jgi:hypothetical protein